MADMLRDPVLYAVPGVENVRVRHDLAYKRLDDLDLLMDEYLPAGYSDGDQIPAVILVHGGPVPTDLRPQPTRWGQYESYGRLLAASGLAVVTFNHRFENRTDLDTPAGDVADAISFVRANAGLLSVDPDRLCIWGISGGGPLLSFVLRDRPDFVRCLVAYYARLDLRHIKDRFPFEERTVETYSPAAYLGNDRPTTLPMFVARAGLDDPTINESIDLFVQRALEANACLTMMNHPEGRHAFDILDDHARTREIIAATINFIKQHV